MDSAFGAQLRQWAEIFRVLAGTAGALLGLTFVMISLRKEIIDRPEVADVRAFAVMILGNFFTILLIALLGLSPTMSETEFGLSLGVLGLIGCGWLLRLVWLNHRLTVASDPAEPWRWVNFAAILVTYVVLVAIGIALLIGHVQAIDWLFPVTIALLALGVFGAWVLLTHANISHADRS